MFTWVVVQTTTIANSNMQTMQYLYTDTNAALCQLDIQELEQKSKYIRAFRS